MRRGLALFISIGLLTVLFAGCVESEADPEPEPEKPTRYEDGRITIDTIDDSAKAWVPTLDEPPQLVLSQYWNVNVELGWGLGDRMIEVVVAGQEDDHWLIGMPTHDFSNDIMVLHIPGLGQVKKDTLGFEAHDHWIDPLQFPLEVGNTWETGFMSDGGLKAEVTKVDGLKATVEIEGVYDITIVYDAEVRTITKFTAWQGDNFYGGYEVVGHGYDWHEASPQWDGTVTVPHMSDLIFCHGSIAVAPVVRDCAVDVGVPEGVVEFEVDIDPDYDRVSFANLIMAMAPGTGVYAEVTATAPDGTAYYDTLTALDGVDAKLVSYHHDMPGGTWTIQGIGVGPVQAFMEGIGYHVYDVELPGGRILPSIGAHEHGDDGDH